MPEEIGPRKIQRAVEDGFKRMENSRLSRVLFLKSFTGQWYDSNKGTIGQEPLNLIFNAIRVLVPNLVANYPGLRMTTDFMAYRDYGEMLAQAVTQNGKKLKVKDIYRAWIVDAIFMMGILKTGLCDSGTAIGFEEDDSIDPGTVYTDNVSLDNLVIDPNCRKWDFSDAAFIGDRIRVSRMALLESGLYDNALIENLPPADQDGTSHERADRLSARRVDLSETHLEDEVEICELWVPRAKAIVTVPGDCSYQADDFLRVADYYGPDTGPYTFLRLTPPVPDNPLPISMVGIWHDLHVMANRMAKKIMEQAERQKDVLTYTGSAADDAQEMLDAADGDAIRVDAVDGVKVHKFGGQDRGNEAHIGQLQQWFNMMAGNPEGMAGMKMDAKSATEANILAGAGEITLSDMRDTVYSGVAEENTKRAWYFHTDPLIDVPLTRRVEMPGPFGMQQQEIQVFLTPEARRGDFLDYAFEVEPESMDRMDKAKRLKAAMDFAVQILPASAQAAQVSLMMGVAFSFPRFCVRMAKEAGITWMDEVFMDPEFQMKAQMMMQAGPQFGPSKGQAGGGLQPNGQPGTAGKRQPTEGQEFNMGAQAGAAEGQAELPIRETY